MQIAIAQLNQVVGDLAGNARGDPRRRSARPSAPARALVVTPELSLCGYPPEDLLLRPAFLDACARELAALAAAVARTRRCSSAFPKRDGGSALQRARGAARRPRRARSTASSSCRTTRCSTRSATSSRARAPCVVDVDGVRVGLVICEDVWFPGPARAGEGGRRAGHRRRQRLAVPHAAAGAAARRRSARARARPGCRSSTSTASAARTSWCSTARRSSSTRDGDVAQQLPAWHETVALVDVRRRRRRSRCAARSIARLEPHVYAGAGDGRARLRRQEPLSRRAARACPAASTRR